MHKHYPSDEPVDADTPCVGCGYNLRGLLPAQTCPECGAKVTRSIFGDELCHSDVNWLIKLRSGTRWLLVFIGLKVLLVILAIGLATVTYQTTTTPTSSGFSIWAATNSSQNLWNSLLMLLDLGAYGLCLWGIYLVTSLEPRQRDNEQSVTLRKMVFITAIIAIVGSVISNAGAMTGQPIAAGLGLLISMVGLWAVLALFWLYRRFAERMLNQYLVLTTTRVMHGLLVSVGILLLGFVLIALVPAFACVFLPFGCLAGVAALVFSLWAVILLIDYQYAFTEEIDKAKEFIRMQESDVFERFGTPKD